LPRSHKGVAMEGKYRELHRLLLWRQLSQSWDPRREFPREQPLYLEIGFGNGEYLLRQAQDRPQHNFLGIEMHWGSVRRCLRRLAQAACQNVRVLQMDAQVGVRYLLPDACIEQFVALFPCPWPKREHERFRLFSTEFMGQLNRICRSGGLVVTDHRGLMEFARAQVDGSGLGLEVIETEARYNTKYERRWSGQGQEIFFELHYRPIGPSPSKQIPEATVQTLILNEFNPDTLVLEGCQAGLVIQFRQHVYDPKREMCLILVTVVEDQLNQTFWIEVTRKEDGLWHIRPALGGGYLPTVGVQRALELVQQAGQAVQTR
jgi:tRNA (guanine-N7-)-methyltransferase